MTHGSAGAPSSPFRQPKAVWAVAFACVVSFMGLGLVDPILPALSKQLHATPSAVELLFTSSLVVTAVAMLITEPLRALRLRGPATMSVTALCYKLGLFHPAGLHLVPHAPGHP